MKTIEEIIDFSPGTIDYSDFIDFDLPLNEQKIKLKEDMLFVKYLDGLYTLDVGWYGGMSLRGQFIIHVVKNNSWDNPIVKQTAKNYDELIIKLNKTINLIRDMIPSSYQ